ncbi:unnamed protein product [Vitrella brassicaformis CCMP3155]|uniref:Uncharacterized protein n=3 Tax=Vitrella brassicaformis TaxID=1169539 RepID=A0A0G4G0B2_VITBC|nr:unnamed protein product [Vitrella brassicaformis CCMP3155]|eukprot:CEM21308.1 unnamed protein product [Vitrella brassicaformis CCMP3155]
MLIPARDRKFVAQELKKVMKKDVRVAMGGEITAGFGGLEVGFALNRDTGNSEETDDKSRVRVQYGKLRASNNWTTLDAGHEAMLSSFESALLTIFIEDSDYRLINHLIHPEDYPDGIAIIRRNPPYAALTRAVIDGLNIEAREAAFRLQNIGTELFLAATESVVHDVSVGLKEKTTRETHEEPDISQLWVRQTDELCPTDVFRLVPKAYANKTPSKTLKVSVRMENKLTLGEPIIEKDRNNSKDEAKYEQWIITPADNIEQPAVAGRGWTSVWCSSSKSEIGPDIAFKRVRDGRIASKLDDQMMTIKCVGMPQYVVAVKTSDQGKSPVMVRAGKKGISMDGLWHCSQPIVAQQAQLLMPESIDIINDSVEGDLIKQNFDVSLALDLRQQGADDDDAEQEDEEEEDAGKKEDADKNEKKEDLNKEEGEKEKVLEAYHLSGLVNALIESNVDIRLQNTKSQLVLTCPIDSYSNVSSSPSPGQLWIIKTNQYCLPGAFCLVPKACPHLTLRVHPDTVDDDGCVAPYLAPPTGEHRLGAFPAATGPLLDDSSNPIYEQWTLLSSEPKTEKQSRHCLPRCPFFPSRVTSKCESHDMSTQTVRLACVGLPGRVMGLSALAGERKRSLKGHVKLPMMIDASVAAAKAEDMWILSEFCGKNAARSAHGALDTRPHQGKGRLPLSPHWRPRRQENPQALPPWGPCGDHSALPEPLGRWGAVRC